MVERKKQQPAEAQAARRAQMPQSVPEGRDQRIRFPPVLHSIHQLQHAKDLRIAGIRQLALELPDVHQAARARSFSLRLTRSNTAPVRQSTFRDTVLRNRWTKSMSTVEPTQSVTSRGRYRNEQAHFGQGGTPLQVAAGAVPDQANLFPSVQQPFGTGDSLRKAGRCGPPFPE